MFPKPPASWNRKILTFMPSFSSPRSSQVAQFTDRPEVRGLIGTAEPPSQPVMRLGRGRATVQADRIVTEEGRSRTPPGGVVAALRTTATKTINGKLLDRGVPHTSAAVHGPGRATGSHARAG